MCVKMLVLCTKEVIIRVWLIARKIQMPQIIYKHTVLIVTSALLIFSLFSTFLVNADDNKTQSTIKEKNLPYNDKNELELARKKLKRAIGNYKKGDLVATKHDLEISVKLLTKASQTSNTKKSREESRLLAIKINAFTQKLNQSPGNNENSLIRFWHHTTSIISREIDHLTHRYVTLATSEKTLKHILDAKMYLYKAEHDLLVSHNSKYSTMELDNVIKSLEKAAQVAIKPIQKNISKLSKEIHSLKEQVLQNQKAWLNNDEIIFLKQAANKLGKAKEKASPQIKPRFNSIEADILSLRTDIERFNIKNNYVSAMKMMNSIINEL